MKKILLCTMVLLLSVGAWGQTTVWSNNNGFRVGYYDDENHFIGVSSLPTDLQKGDFIIVELTTSNQWWNQLKICASNEWENWPATELFSIKDNAYSGGKITISITDEILAAIAGTTSKILFFDGYDCTLTKISVQHNHGVANLYTNSSGYEQGYSIAQNKFSTPLFTAVQAGDMITVNVQAADNGANVIITDTEWDNEATTHASVWMAGAGPAKFILTAELAEAAKTKGLYVHGGNDVYTYIYNSVDLIYAPTVSINAAAGYATFGYAAPLDLTDVDAYTVTVEGTTATLNSIKDKKIAAGTGIILKGSGDVKIPLTTEDTDDVTGNQLKVSDGTVTGDGTIYVLANKTSHGVGFYKLKDGAKIAAGKAYLQIPAGSPAMEFVGFGETTGIENLTPALSEGDGAVYNLNGQHVAQPTKGLYIVNGKKIIVK